MGKRARGPGCALDRRGISRGATARLLWWHWSPYQSHDRVRSGSLQHLKHRPISAGRHFALSMASKPVAGYQVPWMACRTHCTSRWSACHRYWPPGLVCRGQRPHMLKYVFSRSLAFPAAVRRHRDHLLILRTFRSDPRVAGRKRARLSAMEPGHTKRYSHD